MAYTGMDLINKALIIAKKRYEMYKNISKVMEEDFKIAIVANILVRSVEKNIDYYEKLKLELENDDDEIDFHTYDKISFLFNKFSQRFENPVIKDIDEFLRFSLDFENQVVAFYIDIQGRLVKKAEDTEKKAYKILSSIIEEKQKHINNLQMFIKK
ncbi:hypothetical protein [Crassaminicella profunda]|uniref:hypothetical protein n=1 Tax=Crassaminicella profunda TaxID=1286698 RepID=UPI001CA71EA6|nr:hypothetical protein [Crassaminicella profunda]QZY55654.1 hypothetical protein K7H06_01160 [Crassaminicella profunda]